MHHTARAWTMVETAYTQIEKESLGLYSGIVSNRMYQKAGHRKDQG